VRLVLAGLLGDVDPDDEPTSPAGAAGLDDLAVQPDAERDSSRAAAPGDGDVAAWATVRGRTLKRERSTTIFTTPR
jgi:hypothetical protein